MERKLGLAITRNCYRPCDWRNQELSCARDQNNSVGYSAKVETTAKKLHGQKCCAKYREIERSTVALLPWQGFITHQPRNRQPNQNPFRKRTLEIQFARVVPLVKQSREGVKSGSDSKQACGWHNPPFLLINSCSIFPPIFISQTLSTTCLYHSHK